MGPEQFPENKGGRPPPHLPASTPEAGWYLKEGEMNPDEVRSLGHLLHMGMFTGVSQPVHTALHEEHREYDLDNPEPFNVRAVSAERYIEKYAEVYALNADVLKRWAQSASVELAHATIPLLIEERERLAKGEWWSESQIEE